LPPFRVEGSQVVADVAVVLGGVGEGFLRQIEAGGVTQGAAVGLHLLDQGGIVGRVGDDGHMLIVLGRGPHHGRAADVDVLDGVVQGVGLGHGLHERVEVHAHQVDVAQAVLVHGRHVGRVVPHREDAGVDLGMQGLDAAVQHLREAGEFGHVLHRQAGVADGLGGAAGGEEFNAGADSARAKSMRPVLSETERRARLIMGVS
jgi:hypothetical protein